MQRTNAARRAATFCRAASGHIDRKKSNKQQATSSRLQASSCDVSRIAQRGQLWYSLSSPTKGERYESYSQYRMEKDGGARLNFGIHYLYSIRSSRLHPWRGPCSGILGRRQTENSFQQRRTVPARRDSKNIINTCPGSCIQGPRLAAKDEQQAASGKLQAAGGK